VDIWLSCQVRMVSSKKLNLTQLGKRALVEACSIMESIRMHPPTLAGKSIYILHIKIVSDSVILRLYYLGGSIPFNFLYRNSCVLLAAYALVVATPWPSPGTNNKS
jgi:hypothetical protein